MCYLDFWAENIYTFFVRKKEVSTQQDTTSIKFTDTENTSQFHVAQLDLSLTVTQKKIRVLWGDINMLLLTPSCI